MQDSNTPSPLDPDSAWAALTSGLDKPSALGSGVMVAGDNVVPIIGGPKTPSEEELEQSNPEAKELDEEERETTPAIGVGIGSTLSSQSDTSSTLPRPEGIPDDWISNTSEKGGGIIYSNPDNANDYVRVMPGNPNSSNTWQQNPYVINQNGSFLDVNGDPILGDNPGKTKEAHIPYNDFRFKR